MRLDILKSILPDKDCNRCYGRGTEGRNTETGEILFCRCVLKKYNEQLEKHGQLVLEGKLVHKDGNKYEMEGGRLVRK